MKLLIKLLLTLVLLGLVIVGWAAYNMQRYLETPMAVVSPVSLTVASGSTLRSVLRQMRSAGITTNTHWLLLRARLDDEAHKIKAGDYTIPVGATPASFLQQMIDGQVNLEQLTLIEGWTAAQAVAAIVKHPKVTDDLEVALALRANGEPWLSPETHTKLADLLQIDRTHIEGQLAPDTYRFAAGTNASDLLRQSYQLMTSRISKSWQSNTPPDVLADPYALLVLASIVEKESGVAAERREIAGVFVRRLQRKMRLQTDPTVIYGAGLSYDGDIRRSDLKAATAYNTYVINGLPPTPISLPGAASIEAVMDPADGDALYFVASGKGDGSHVFSVTLEEHQNAVAQYLRRLKGLPVNEQ